jgi:hypothetical protein
MAAFAPIFRPLRGATWAAYAAGVAVLVVALAGLGLLAFLLLRTDDDSSPSAHVVNGRLSLPREAIMSLDSFKFTTSLEATSEGASNQLSFAGQFQKPHRISGELKLGQGYEQTRSLFGFPDRMEIVVVDQSAWWREPSGERQTVRDLGDQENPLVYFRQYGTPWFYLEALLFDKISLPASDHVEEVNGVRSIPARLDKQGIVDVLNQAAGVSINPDSSPNRGSVGPAILDTVREEVPESFEVLAWFAESDLHPVRIVFSWTFSDTDSPGFFGSGPATTRVQMDIFDPNADVEIEPPIAGQ